MSPRLHPQQTRATGPDTVHARRRLLMQATLALAAVLPAWHALAADPAPVIIAHPGVAKADSATLAKLYTGRAIELGGQPVQVANLAPGSPVRQRFLGLVLQQDEERYRGYWMVRRHVGKGVPPREMGSAAEMIDWVQSTPGAIGYVDVSDLKPGLNVLTRF